MNSAPSRRESFHGSHKSFFLMMTDCMKASTTDDAYAETHRCVPFHGHTLAAAATVGIGVNAVGGWVFYGGSLRGNTPLKQAFWLWWHCSITVQAIGAQTATRTDQRERPRALMSTPTARRRSHSSTWSRGCSTKPRNQPRASPPP